MARERSRRRPLLVSGEEAHRRLVLLGIAGLLLLSVGPVFGHHLSEGIERSLSGLDHLGPLCLIALHALLEPIHLGFHLLVAGGLAYATLDRARALHKVRGVLAALEIQQPAPGDTFWAASFAIGLDPRRVGVVTGLPSPAFTIGWIRPRIYVAESLGTDLTSAELEAVLAHEHAHILRRDPLRLSLLRFLALLLFWIPALRRLAADAVDETEIRADDYAAGDRPLALASALLTLARWRSPAPELRDVVAFSQRLGLLDRRIRRLAGESPPVQSHVTRASIAGALVALTLVTLSGVLMAHPLPVSGADHHLAHCEHPGAAVTSHLFCLSDARSDHDGLCPHAERSEDR